MHRFVVGLIVVGLGSVCVAGTTPKIPQVEGATPYVPGASPNVLRVRDRGTAAREAKAHQAALDAAQQRTAERRSAFEARRASQRAFLANSGANSVAFERLRRVVEQRSQPIEVFSTGALFGPRVSRSYLSRSYLSRSYLGPSISACNSVAFVGMPQAVAPFVSTPSEAQTHGPEAPYGSTAIEQAQLAWLSGDVEGAVAAYSEHLDSEPEDWDTARLYGLALIDAGRMRDGIAMVGLAYRRDSGLAQRPIDAAMFRVEPLRLRELVRSVVRASHREESASGWLTAGALMQAEGRLVPARRMIERSAEQGLPESVAVSMRLALRHD